VCVGRDRLSPLLGRALGMRTAFSIAAGTVSSIDGRDARWLREPPPQARSPSEESLVQLSNAGGTNFAAVRPGMRAIFSRPCAAAPFQTFNHRCRDATALNASA